VLPVTPGLPGLPFRSMVPETVTAPMQKSRTGVAAVVVSEPPAAMSTEVKL